MERTLNKELGDQYRSGAQKRRIITEDWVSKFLYCPSCGYSSLDQYPNNRPVADFFCSECNEDFELKSSKNPIRSKIVDGEYQTMINRLSSDTNPNLLILDYSHQEFSVRNLFVIPKQYFVPEVIERRKPLSASARRAGWTGCNILLDRIPQAGRIYVAEEGRVVPKKSVLSDWKSTLFLREQKSLSTKSWLLDVMMCVENIRQINFSLADVYAFENDLQRLHPDNRHVRDKIRQQLQVLRDAGRIQFVSRGQYSVLP